MILRWLRGATVAAGTIVEVSTVNPLPVAVVSTVIYQLATNLAINSGSSTTPVTGILAGSYIWDVSGATFGGATLTLEALGSDGVTYNTVDTLTANGRKGVVLGANATARITGSVANATGVSSSLS